MIKNKIQNISIFLLFLFLVNPVVTIAETSKYYEDQINKLKEKSGEKNTIIQDAKQKQKEYQDIINKKRQEKNTLKSEKEDIESQILKTKFKIIENESSIEKNQLDIQTLDLEITQIENNILEQKVKIGEFVKMIYQDDNKGVLDMLLLNDSISDFLNQIKYTESIQNGLSLVLLSYKDNKESLTSKKKELSQKMVELENSKIDLEIQKDDLANEKARLSTLISETQNQEAIYQKILANAIAEQKRTEQEIAALEKSIRDNTFKFKTAKEQEQMQAKILQMGGAVSNNSLNWPVPFNSIYAYFHDPNYVFKKQIGEHSAIDIKSKQGTPIYAPAGGYVVRAADKGMGYSYILLVHGNNISTLYGHISSFAVKEDQYVKTGQLIGYTGGAPGTRGAGPFSTGPHLHFEVRLNGIPVNPLEYLKMNK